MDNAPFLYVRFFYALSLKTLPNRHRCHAVAMAYAAVPVRVPPNLYEQGPQVPGQQAWARQRQQQELRLPVR